MKIAKLFCILIVYTYVKIKNRIFGGNYMAKMKKIEVSLGITMELNGTYVKPNATIEIDLDESDNTKEKREQIWRAAWDMVEAQVVGKIADLKGE